VSQHYGGQPATSQLYGGGQTAASQVYGEAQQQHQQWSDQQLAQAPQPSRLLTRGQGDGPARQYTAGVPGVYGSGGDAGGHQWAGLQQNRKLNMVAEEPATQGGETQPVLTGENDEEYRRQLCRKMFSPLR